ncbi:MAG: hypothetical protein ACRD8W_05725 [Nitrososphaeraceae archaeon]
MSYKVFNRFSAYLIETMKITKRFWIVILASVALSTIGIAVLIESYSISDPETPALVQREKMDFGRETKSSPALDETVIVKRNESSS